MYVAISVKDKNSKAQTSKILVTVSFAASKLMHSREIFGKQWKTWEYINI